MRKPYLKLSMLLLTAFAFVAAMSMCSDVRIFGYKITLMDLSNTHAPQLETQTDKEPFTSDFTKENPDSSLQIVLFIGDSMLEGLSPRLGAYAEKNNFRLISVIWYGSTTEKWAKSEKLQLYIEKYHPCFLLICIGSNELFVRNVKEKRAADIDKLIKDAHSIPFAWIGPPNWKDDTGINELLQHKVGTSRYFESQHLVLKRASDGMHPTRNAAGTWMDSIASWLANPVRYPIELKRPDKKEKAPYETIVLTPDD